jgi:hypothetical protein
MKLCLVCGALAETTSCPKCGNADWRPLPPSTDSAPVAPETTTRPKRNR